MTAWVGKSVVFKGELLSSEDITIDGRVEGSIDVHDHAVTIGPDADIQADILGKVVTIEGRVSGHIIASGKVHLHRTASVSGDISAPTLVMVEGAQLQGRVETSARSSDRPREPRVTALA